MSKGFWANLFSPPREKFSLEELQHLHTVLMRNQVVTDGNRETVVEALRSISELVIWGDQHDSSIVEYFLTENLLGHFHQILLQKTNRSGNVAMQVLQTLSILIQNVRTQQTVYYLFSNDHINDIAALRFDFEDDEVLGYYVNLLKTISLRLNENTVQFFFHSEGTAKHGGAAAFPLYTEATKFVAHRDAMVRAAVKTLTLNVFTIPLPSLQDFICRPPAAAYFDKVAAHAAERCGALDRLLSSWDAPAPAAGAAVETLLAEIEDVLSYCNDVLSSGAVPLRALLLRHLWEQVFGPVLFWPLEMLSPSSLSSASEKTVPLNSTHTTNNSTNTTNSTSTSNGASSRGIVGPLCSIYVFERLLHAATDPALVSMAVAALLGGPAREAAETLAESLVHSVEEESVEERRGLEKSKGVSVGSAMNQKLDADALLAGLRVDPLNIRSRVLGVLHSGTDAQLTAGVLRVLATILSHRTLPEATLEAVGLLPRRRRKQRELLEVLTRDTSSPALPEPAVISVPLAIKHEGSMEGRIEESREDRIDDAAAMIIGGNTPIEGNEEDEEEDISDAAARMPVLRRYSPRSESMSAIQRSAAPTITGDAHFTQIIEGILAALHMELLPPLAIGAAGWTLHSLLASSAGGADMTTEWNAAVQAALTPWRAAVKQLLTGQWADAVLPLMQHSWEKSRAAVLRIGAGPLHLAAHTWAQGILLQELHWQLGGAQEQVSASNAAVAAKLAYISVQSFVGLLQIEEILGTGQIQERLMGALGALQASVAVPGAGGVFLPRSGGEVKEGSVVAPIGLASIPRCKVAFTKGTERTVLLAVEGMPLSSSIQIHQQSDTARSKPDHQDKHYNTHDSLLSAQQQAAAAAAGCVPVAALLDPDLPSEGKATVLSTAPLLGTFPSTDQARPEWLHVDVRPSVAVLLKAVNGASAGVELAALDKSIASGHWVVAFGSAEGASAAAEGLVEAISSFRQVHMELLEPFLVGGGGGNGGEGGGEQADDYLL